MTDAAPRVLFVSHEATRSGAPIMFLQYLRWLADHTDLDFEILLLAGGPLVPDFEAVAPTTHIEALGTSSATYLEAGMSRAGFPRASDRLKLQRVRRSVKDLVSFDAVYLNSTTSALALRILPELPPLLFSHIHELNSAFRYWFPEPDRTRMLARTDWYVACADAVAANLVEAYAVDPERVSRHYEFVEPAEPDPMRAKDLRRRAGVPLDAPLVGGSGQVIWRKGPDLFVQMAAKLTRDHPELDAHFVWIGCTGQEVVPTEQDIDKLGLRGRVHFVGEVTNPVDLYADLDVFCLTSREDPFPLVMLEAAAQGVPVVAFANGGAVEFAGPAEGNDTRRAAIVDYLDVSAMAAEAADLLGDEAARRSLGERGRNRVLGRHVTAIAAPALYEDMMDRLLGGSASPAATTPPPPSAGLAISAGRP